VNLNLSSQIKSGPPVLKYFSEYKTAHLYNLQFFEKYIKQCVKLSVQLQGDRYFPAEKLLKNSHLATG
jgi:hypothetical protein